MISPKALKSKDFSCSLVEIDALINGRKLSVIAFPHSSQDTETITCAETTICGIMEYFGNKYAEYKPVLPSKIISVLSQISYERQIPSRGLTADQISFALKNLVHPINAYLKKEIGGKRSGHRIEFPLSEPFSKEGTDVHEFNISCVWSGWLSVSEERIP